MARSASNPQAVRQMFQQMASSNPAVAKMLEMTNNRTPEEMNQIVQNLARQQGVDLNQLKQQMGIYG